MTARKPKPKRKALPRKRKGGAPKGNKNALGNPGGKGRKPRYSKDLIPIVRTMVLHGATDAEIAAALKVSTETLRWWKRVHVEFANGIRVTDEEMAEGARNSLYTRAMGFTFKSEKVFQFQGEIIRAKVTEFVPPDVNAAFKVLQAYDKAQAFREKSEVTSTFSLADLVALSMEDRKARKAKLIENQPNAEEDDESPSSRGLP